jgi:hypothetical protein
VIDELSYLTHRASTSSISGPPEVMLAYILAIYTSGRLIGEDVERKEAFVRLQVYIFPSFFAS